MVSPLSIWDAHAENQAQTLKEYWGEKKTAADITRFNLPETRVLFIGDSILAGYGLEDYEESGVVPQLVDYMELEHTLEWRDTNFRNFSISGETTSGMVSRMRQIVGSEPDIAVVAIGGNDALRGVDPDVVYNNLNIILNDLSRAGVYVLFVGMQSPPNFGYTYMSKFNSVYAKLAEQYSVVFMPFLLEGVAANHEMNQDDGIHPNQFGAKVIAKNMAPYLEKMIKAFRKEQSAFVEEERMKAIRETKLKKRAKQEQAAREYELRKQKLKRKYDSSLKK
jgi:acyl-CoA thioesterase I